MKAEISVLILGAGKGKRMKSGLPKVLHPLLGRPILFWVIENAMAISKDVTVVLGHNFEQVKTAIESAGYQLSVVKQDKLNGTGGAVRVALSSLKHDYTLILCADMPLIKPTTLRKLIRQGQKVQSGSILAAQTDEPGSYGRLWLEKGFAVKIVEYADLVGQQESNIVNTGAYFIKTSLLRELVKRLRVDNKQGEYYLTDIVELLAKRGMPLKVVFCKPAEALGINSRQDLVVAEDIARKEIIRSYLASGVTIQMPETVMIEVDVKIGRDTIIMPFTVIRKGVRIGKNCQIGPFAHLRPGTRIGDNCIVGNFVEVNRSVLADKVYAKHLTYLGDTVVGEGTNVGAGTITANYDGVKKNQTRIGKKAFIGSGAILIAPVKVGNNAIVGAGAVVTKGHNVRDNEIVVGLPARPLCKRQERKDG